MTLYRRKIMATLLLNTYSKIFMTTVGRTQYIYKLTTVRIEDDVKNSSTGIERSTENEMRACSEINGRTVGR